MKRVELLVKKNGRILRVVIRFFSPSLIFHRFFYIDSKNIIFSTRKQRKQKKEEFGSMIVEWTTFFLVRSCVVVFCQHKEAIVIKEGKNESDLCVQKKGFKFGLIYTDIFISLLLKTQQKSNRKSSVVTRADWSLGSDVNNIVVFNTAALLFAGRFGFAPTVKKNYGGSTSYAMTEAAKPAVGSRDPAGFTAVDVLAFGSLAHIISAGEIFGMHMK